MTVSLNYKLLKQFKNIFGLHQYYFPRACYFENDRWTDTFRRNSYHLQWNIAKFMDYNM